MFKYEQDSLIRITEKLKRVLSHRLKAVIAFGSKVRGDFNGESDFDVLVIVDGLTIDDEVKIIQIFSKEEDLTGIPYAPVIKSLGVFEKEREYNTGFFRSIMSEGVFLYDSISRGKESTCRV
ncbi:nucleotidyltransferase domain-containing protein [Thermodesulfovibrio aggregans]|uniref:Nucleotidyltransferase domain-containing protein n=1 Tax=Thermodesulfovibrio aggregans TaxID=86166 RepID=A0A0U9HXH7_9BACT|nr:nucleotidyltransferase domain-containing protein [Thermodesulfovibrio aggregans]GAQ95661.1 nucleotidyltransferase domain-containing protein [Thermodesulfovibrio aggregans]